MELINIHRYFIRNGSLHRGKAFYESGNLPKRDIEIQNFILHFVIWGLVKAPGKKKDMNIRTEFEIVRLSVIA